MSISIRGLPVFRPLSLSRLLNQTNRTFSFSLRRETTSLRFTNTSYAFPLSPQSHIQPEQTGESQANFLEEPTEEYGHPETSEFLDGSPAACSSADQAGHVVLRMIGKRDLDRALAARDEFVKLGVKIEQDHGFAGAAFDALSIVNPEIRSRQFIAWWSLTPLRECPEQLPLVQAKVMEHPFDIPLLMDFCILCAKAGFAHAVEKSQIFSHIFRYGHPNATTAFLVKIEREARKHAKDVSSRDWMSMRNLAIRMHLVAGRKLIAREMYDGAVANGFLIEPRTTEFLDANESPKSLPPEFISTKTLLSDGPKDPRRRISDLALELRILRMMIVSRGRPPHFENFLAEFIDAYELLGRRSRAIHMLRKKVFKDGTLAVRARWVAGEQMAYSRRRRPIAVLRTFMSYCLADSILAAEARRILTNYRIPERFKPRWIRDRDWKLSQRPIRVDWKIWPSNGSMAMAWKAVLQLSKKEDISRLYALFLQYVEAARSEPKQVLPGLETTSDVTVADKHYYDISSHAIAVPPAVFPDPYYFHHFVVAFAARRAPREGAQVIQDMQRLGFAPSKETWGALAGAYARSGDIHRAARILDHLDRDVPRPRPVRCWRNGKRVIRRYKTRPSRSLIATHNSILRGFTEAGMFREALTIQERMQELGCFKGGVDKRTRSILHRLSRYEEGKHDQQLFGSNQTVVAVDGKQLAIDEKRVEWLDEMRS